MLLHAVLSCTVVAIVLEFLYTYRILGSPFGFRNDVEHFKFIKNEGNTCYLSSLIALLKKVKGISYTNSVMAKIQDMEFGMIGKRELTDLMDAANSGSPGINKINSGIQNDPLELYDRIMRYVSGKNPLIVEVEVGKSVITKEGKAELYLGNGNRATRKNRCVFVGAPGEGIFRTLSELLDNIIWNDSRYSELTSGEYYFDINGNKREIPQGVDVNYEVETTYTPGSYFVLIVGNVCVDTRARQIVFITSPFERVRFFGKTYEPLSIICRTRSFDVNSGHYTNYCLSDDERIWIRYDDISAIGTEAATIRKDDYPYMILLRKVS